jgi:hypothetical protein
MMLPTLSTKSRCGQRVEAALSVRGGGAVEER